MAASAQKMMMVLFMFFGVLGLGFATERAVGLFYGVGRVAVVEHVDAILLSARGDPDDDVSPDPGAAGIELRIGVGQRTVEDVVLVKYILLAPGILLSEIRRMIPWSGWMSRI